jgi:hypothetical protein
LFLANLVDIVTFYEEGFRVGSPITYLSLIMLVTPQRICDDSFTSWTQKHTLQYEPKAYRDTEKSLK